MDTQEPTAATGRGWRWPARLSLLLLAVESLSLSWTVLNFLGGAWSLVVVLLALLVTAHVLGNSLGSRLRDDDALRTDQPLPAGAVPIGGLLPARFATRAPRLSERRRLSLAVPALSLCGAVLGAIFAPLILFSDPPAPQPLEYFVGVVSFAVLGGLAGFCAGGLLVVGLWPCVTFFFRGDPATQ